MHLSVVRYSEPVTVCRLSVVGGGPIRPQIWALLLIALSTPSLRGNTPPLLSCHGAPCAAVVCLRVIRHSDQEIYFGCRLSAVNRPQIWALLASSTPLLRGSTLPFLSSHAGHGGVFACSTAPRAGKGLSVFGFRLQIDRKFGLCSHRARRRLGKTRLLSLA